MQTGVEVRNRQIWVKIGDFLSYVTLKFEVWPRKTIGHLFHAISNFVHHFIAICKCKMELQSGNAKFGSKSTIFVPCDLDIWRMTLKNNRAPLLCYFKLCASFHSHPLIQTAVTVRKRLSWVLTSVTLTFYLDLCMDITSVIGNRSFMILWWYDDRNIVKKVWRTDRRKEVFLELLCCS